MSRNWYSPWSPVVTERSVLDSALASTTLAPTTALPVGSVTVPRTEVVACALARPLRHKTNDSRTMAANTVGRRSNCLLNAASAAENIPCLPVISITFSLRGRKPETLLEFGKVNQENGQCQVRNLHLQDRHPARWQKLLRSERSFIDSWMSRP